jgi:Mg-chelatase subunit ChlD
VEVPLTDDISALRTAVLMMAPGGDTFYAKGIEKAHEELMLARDPDARQTILIVTDGQVHDQPDEAIAAAHADGIEISLLIYPNTVLRPTLEPSLVGLFGDADRLFWDLRPRESRRAADQVRNWIYVPGLLQSVDIVDEIPDNMRLVPNSVDPPAEMRGNTLRWTLQDVTASKGVSLTYRLEPQEVGIHPTNIWAGADFVDALGFEGSLRFPVPMVEVTRTHHAYLPVGLTEKVKHGFRKSDIVLVMDTSTSMAGEKLRAATIAAGDFGAIALKEDNRVALVSFNSDAKLELQLTADPIRVMKAMAQLRVSAGTRIDKGLEVALDELDRVAGTTTRSPVLIVLTDGLQTDEPERTIDVAADALVSGIELYAIGLGGDVDEDFLRMLVGKPERAYFAPTAEDLAEVYRTIVREIPCQPDDYWGRRCP